MSRETLLKELDATRSAHQAVVSQVSPHDVVYDQSGWRVQDIIAHITHWEVQVLNTLEYALRGERYYVPSFRELGIDGFNAADYERHREDTADMVLRSWDDVRADLKRVILSASEALWESPLKWLGQEVLPEQMIMGIVWHEKHHINEIVAIKEGL
jgi:hypothetical protein